MSYPPGPPGPHDAEEPGPAEPPRPPGGAPQGGQQPTGAPPPGYGPPGGYQGGPQQGGPHPGGPHPGYSAPAPTNTKATAALITGITTLVLSWCCGFGVLGVVAIILGVKARSEIRDSRGAQQGDGIALAGIITGAVAILIGVLMLIVIIVAIASGQAAYYEYYNQIN